MPRVVPSKCSGPHLPDIRSRTFLMSKVAPSSHLPHVQWHLPRVRGTVLASFVHSLLQPSYLAGRKPSNRVSHTLLVCASTFWPCLPGPRNCFPNDEELRTPHFSICAFLFWERHSCLSPSRLYLPCVWSCDATSLRAMVPSSGGWTLLPRS